MVDQWSSSRGGTVLLALADNGGAGRRAGLEEALRQAVRDGRLAPGTRLPSSRVLATDMGLARGTVVAAYEQLVAEGWLVARPGSATIVADIPSTPPRPTPDRDDPGPYDDPRIRHDLRPGQPDPSSFPRTAWAAAVRQALTATADTTFGFGDPRGLPALRRALSDYLARARGVVVDPGRVVVTNGFLHGLVLLARTLRSRGATTAAIEDPTIPAHRIAVDHAGLTVRSLPVDADGAAVDRLGELSADAVLVTPAHQYPLGVTLVPERRAALVGWVRATGGLVMEDDYDGEFRYDRQPIGALQSLDPEHVAYLGTVSKSLSPALRLGWLVLPTALVDAVVAERMLTDRYTGVTEQLAFGQLLSSGAFDRHLRRMRLRYRRRRDHLIAALAEQVPALRPTGVAAGIHVVVGLPERGPGAEEVVTVLAERGVGVHCVPGALVVGYGSPPEHGYRAAVEALADGLVSIYGRLDAGRLRPR